MARTGTYSLTKTRDTSFRNFIFVLLIVLALLVLIYLVMTFGISASKGIGKDSTASGLSGEGKTNDSTTTTLETEKTALPNISYPMHSESTEPSSTTEEAETDSTETISSKKILSSTDRDRTTFPSTSETIDTNSNAIGSSEKEETTTPEKLSPIHTYSTTTFGTTTETPKTNLTTTISNANIFPPIDNHRTTLSNTSETIDTSSTTISTIEKEETTTPEKFSPIRTYSTTTSGTTTETPKNNSTTTISTANIFSPIDNYGSTLSTTSEIIDTNSTTISTIEKEETTTSEKLPPIHTYSTTTFSTTTETPKTNLTTTISTVKIFPPIDNYRTTLSRSTSETIEVNSTTISTTVPKESSIHSDLSTASSTTEVIQIHPKMTHFIQQSTENTSVITAEAVIVKASSVKTCEDIACKKASSELLAMMNHDENLDYCEDFYNYACGNPSITEGVDDTYFQLTSKAIVAQTKRNSNNSKYSEIFNDFYDDCNKYKDDFILKDTLNNLKFIEQQPLTNIFVHLLLTQSMPFFDVGLGVKDTHSFEFEITLPGISSLRTTLPEWSLMEQIKLQCIRDINDQFMKNHIYVDDSMNSTHDCIKNNTKNYIIRFVKEMEELQALFADKLLVTSFRNHSDGLQNLIGNIQDYLLINIDTLRREEANHELITLEEMNTLYKFVDWITVFTGITRNINITGKTYVKINFHNRIKKALSEIEKEQEIQGILNLWYNIQLFRSAGFGKSYGRLHCLKLASQLMPEIGVSLVNDVYLKQKSVLGQYERVQKLFQQLKSRFNNSFSMANITSASVAVLQNRLNDIQLRSNVTNRFDREILSNSTYENDLDMANKSYHEKLIVLLENYRKTVFSLAGQSFEDLAEYLLLYFVDPFEIEPKTFPPSRHIVFHPGFVYDMSKKLPSYVELATKGFRLGQQMTKHFVKDDFGPELGVEEKQMYMQLAESDQAEANLIRMITYKFDNDEYYIENSECYGKCLNGAEIFEDNAAFRLVTDSLEDLKDKNLNRLPYLDDTMSTEKYFVSFIAHELCQRQTIVDFLADLYRGKLPPPVKMRNMVVNSNFFKKLYNCKKYSEENMNQFPYIVISTEIASLGSN